MHETLCSFPIFKIKVFNMSYLLQLWSCHPLLFHDNSHFSKMAAFFWDSHISSPNFRPFILLLNVRRSLSSLFFIVNLQFSQSQSKQRPIEARVKAKQCKHVSESSKNTVLGITDNKTPPLTKKRKKKTPMSGALYIICYEINVRGLQVTWSLLLPCSRMSRAMRWACSLVLSKLTL